MRKHLLLASTLLLFGCAELAIKQTAGPDDLIELKRQAAAAYQDKDYVQALPLYQRLTEEIPGDAYLWFRLGNNYARLKQPDEAINAYQRAVLLDQTLSTPWYNMAILQLRQAVNSLTQMLLYIPPDDPLYPRALVLSEETLRILEKPGIKNDQAVSEN